MPELAEQLKKIDLKLDETLLAATAAQATASELKEAKAANDTTVKKAVEDSTAAMAEVQELKLSIGAITKTQEFIEKSISRMGGSGAANDELAEKAGEEMACYLRSGMKMTAETLEAITRALCTKSFHGIPEDRRESELKTLIAGNNPQGGYFIRPDRSAKMIQRIFESSPVRAFANIETTNSDTFEILIDDDEASSGGWVGEVQKPRGETDTPNIGLLTIPVHEQFAQPKATQKMLDDAGFDIESWLQGKVTRKLSRDENTAFVNGDGAQKPKGFLQLPAWAAAGVYERNALEQVNSGASGAFTADGLKGLQNSLIEEYQASAIFGLKRASFQQIITLKDGTGAYLLDPRSMKVGDTLTLLGKQVVFMNDMPAVADNALAAVYGDFSVGYTIIDRIGFRVIRDELTQKGCVLFYTTKRTGGDVTSFEALKIQKLAV